MKYLISSDLHGDLNSLKSLIKIFKENKCDKIIFLGDYLGSDRENNQNIIDILNLFKSDIIALRGNCDTNLDSSIDFELRDSFFMSMNSRYYLFIHGDKLEQYLSTNIGQKLYIVYGHTHRYRVYQSGDFVFINLGSIAYPRGGLKRCYGILDESAFKIYDIDSELLYEI